MTDSLRARTQPINTNLKSVLQSRDDRAKQIKQLRGRDASGELEEAGIRSKERDQFAQLVATAEQADIGSNPSSMYELCGEYLLAHTVALLTALALVSHKGASADSGEWLHRSR